MSNAIYKASSAQVIEQSANRRVRVIDISNPEVLISVLIKDFFIDAGFTEEYPNFGDINIGTVHPFALFLFAEVKGESQNFTVLPSITVSNGTTEDYAATLNRNEIQVVIDAEWVTKAGAYKDAGAWFISDTGYSNLLTGTANGNKLMGVKTMTTNRELFTLEVWSDNKDITSLVYDMLYSFVTSSVLAMGKIGISYEGVSGQRSGDINLDFGRILYGASVTLQAARQVTSLAVDFVTEIIGSFIVGPQGQPL